MIELLFPDGLTVRGATYREVEDALRAAQWDTYPSRRAFRREMRKRALVWSGTRVSLSLTSKGFLESLARAALFRIET